VDWSSLGTLNEKKFGDIEIIFIKWTVRDIPYTPVPEWSRRNPKLVDEPGTLIPEGREPKKLRLGRADNDMETVFEEAFANMDDDIEDMEDQEKQCKN
jgi:hypothetical protein